MKKRNNQSARGRNRTYMVAGVTFIFFIGVINWLISNNQSVEDVSELQVQDSRLSVDEMNKESSVIRHEEQKVDEITNPQQEPLRAAEKVPFTEDSSTSDQAAESAKPANPIEYVEGTELPKEPKIIDGILLANKQYPLPKDYAPGESEEAREAFNELAAEALKSGINLQAFSTYRSYEYQVTLYERYVKRDGQEAADRYSARPGYSEHQTGLAFDIGEVNHEDYWASTSFGDTEAAKWLAAHAHKYGFILRYPKDKEEITGYIHESWHYRYVGKEVAEKIFKQNITLEEYVGVR